MLLSIYAAAVMSQKCEVVKRSAEPDSINWELCCLCQEEKDDHLSMPKNQSVDMDTLLKIYLNFKN